MGPEGAGAPRKASNPLQPSNPPTLQPPPLHPSNPFQPPPGTSDQVVHLLSTPELTSWVTKGGETSFQMAPSLEYSKLLESKKIISTVFRFFLYCLCFRDMDFYATLQSLDFVNALRRLPNVDGQPPSQLTKWWHKRLQEVGGQLHPQTCKEGLPLK